MKDDPYLWDRSEPVDAEIERLERTLKSMRYTPSPLAYPKPWRRLALAAVVALAVGTSWLLVREEPTGFPVEAVAGTATIDRAALRSGTRLAVGSWLETGAGAAVELRIADIGLVTVHGDTRLGLLESRAGSVHRLQLDRGRIEALITAPPRLFFVNTPSAVAVDLGCAYELTVDETGDGLLEVTLGWVALERDDSVVTVPDGASCRLYAGHGPGVPWFGDATAALRSAVDRFETSGPPGELLDVILAESRPRDALTLWHLLPRVDDDRRPDVIARLTDLVGMPPGITAEGVAGLDRSMLDAWWTDIELDW